MGRGGIVDLQLLTLALLAAAAGGASPLRAQYRQRAAPPVETPGVALFRKGDMGYDSFRGTVLLQEVGRPWLIAFACGRKGGGDASGRTLFLRRSSDAGRSWDAPRVWATASNESLKAGDGVYMGSAVFDTTTNTSLIFWGECLEACAGQHGMPRRSNETVWSAPSFIMTRSTDSFQTWVHENLTAINDVETFPINTYGYGLSLPLQEEGDDGSGDGHSELLFCGPYATHTAGCMSSTDGGHKFTALANVTAPSSVGSWSEQQMARLLEPERTTSGSVGGVKDARTNDRELLMMIGHNTGASAKSSGFLASFSSDTGRSWNTPIALPRLVQPGCQGSILAPAPRGSAGGSTKTSGLVIISHPNNGTGYLPGMHDPARNHMTLSWSRNGWEHRWEEWSHHLIFSGYSGYSAMQDLSVGSAGISRAGRTGGEGGEEAVAIIYERGEKRFDEDVWVSVVPYLLRSILV